MAIFLVIIPTIVAIILRSCLYKHLQLLRRKVQRLLGGSSEEMPGILSRLHQRFQINRDNWEQLNTSALIDSLYSQEKFNCLGISFSCQSIEYFGRILPNLLLSFGLLGTFLGITINLANLSQTITQIDINDVRSLVEELNQPLQGMGIAFITSLIAIACSSLLTVINLSWNTNLTKTNLLNSLEDYVDNFYLPQMRSPNPIDRAMERFNRDMSKFLVQLGDRIEQSVVNAFTKIDDSAATFKQAANILDSSQFPAQLASATTDLAIAQSQFAQSSLVLQKSTQSFEHSLNAMEQASRKIIEIGEQIERLNQKYASLIAVSHQKNTITETGLKEIQTELAKLVEKIRQL